MATKRKRTARTGSVYRRADSPFLWIAYYDANGARVPVSTETTDEETAAKLLATINRQVKAEQESGLTGPDLGPITVERYARRWIKDRRDRDIASTDDDETRLKHTLPLLGELALSEVRPRHVLKAIRKFEAMKDKEGKPKFAPRTILHIYGVLRVMFADAVREELISATPCVLSAKRRELPKKRDKDLTWRQKAVYVRDEVVQLITSHNIPEHRRVLYALLNMTGMRINEVTPRRFGHYEPDLRPLGKLLVASCYDVKRKVEKPATKTGVVREVPVHPALARILHAWQTEGWARCYGRPPTPEDFIIPGMDGEILNSTMAYKRLVEDLAQLGLRHRRQHDTRRTFISLAREDGAQKDLLRWVTHGPEGEDIVDAYTTPSWPVLCEQVACLKLPLPKGFPSGGGETAVATSLLREMELPEMTTELMWRRRESNPRPKAVRSSTLRA